MPKVPNKQQKCLLLWSANASIGSFSVPLQAAVLTGSNMVSTRRSLFLNTNYKHLLIKIVQTGTKESAIKVSKLQGRKGSWNIMTSCHWFREISSTFLSTSDQINSYFLYHTTITWGMDVAFYTSSFIKVSVFWFIHLKSEDFFKTLIKSLE